ncbi:MAG: type II toxin-antitoxin system VapC family toxin [Chloroflexota bacterium]
MSDPEGLLDTSVVLALHAITDASDLPEVALISAVTLAELSVGPLVAADDVERARRLATVQQVEADFDPLPFDAAAARAFGRVAASYRRLGRKPAARSFDAMIAATALANGLPLYTANADDFAGIDGLVIRPVSAPGRGG